MSQDRTHEQELASMRMEQVDATELARGDPRHHNNKCFFMFRTALKMFMKLSPQYLVNVRGIANARLEQDPDQLCELGFSFFKRAAETK